MGADSPHDPSPFQPSTRDLLRDKRVQPRGTLPRHLQTWLMVGIAGVMLLIIVVTGRPVPPKRAESVPAQPSGSMNPERLRRYQEQLAEQETRLRQELAETQAASAAAKASPAPPQDEAPADPMVEEQRRRAYSSLFADNVAFSRRNDSSAGLQAGQEIPRSAGLQASPRDMTSEQAPGSAGLQSVKIPRSAGLQASPRDTTSELGAPLQPDLKRLLEGTIIEAVLTNRLEGSFAGPVNALVTAPVYALDRQAVLIPAGARVLGTAAPVQAVGESRLAVKFHRLVMPDGQTYSLDKFTGLNQRGDAGLSDRVNRHYLQVFGASIAIGALSGLAQYSTRSATTGAYSFSDAYGQGVAGSLAASSARILDRFLNLLPTITIREGHRLKIYLTSDLDLPPYEGDRP